MSQYIIKYYNPETGEQFTDLTKYSSKSHAIANLKQELYSRVEKIDSEENIHKSLNKIFKLLCNMSGCNGCFRWDECYGVKRRRFENYSQVEKIKICAKMADQCNKQLAIS